MRKNKNLDLPIGKLTKVDDFLPPPQDLVLPEDTVKVTIAISKSSLKFFKKQAKINHVKYQRMIRKLLDKYVLHYSHS